MQTYRIPVLDCIQVLVVDEHAAVRRALATCVAAYDDLCLSGQAASGEEAIRLCGCIHPDVILLDLTLPDMTGAATVKAIREVSPRVPVIVLCTFQEEGLVGEALRAGAVGYLLKNVSAEQLARAIRSAYAGRSGPGGS